MVASALKLSNFVRFLNPSKASPPRLCARFFRIGKAGSRVVGAVFEVEVERPFSLFGKRGGTDVDVLAIAPRDARAR